MYVVRRSCSRGGTRRRVEILEIWLCTNVMGQMAVELEAQDVHMFQREGRSAGSCGLSVMIGRCVLSVRGNLNQGPAFSTPEEILARIR
jgi:hypothetical protein